MRAVGSCFGVLATSCVGIMGHFSLKFEGSNFHVYLTNYTKNHACKHIYEIT